MDYEGGELYEQPLYLDESAADLMAGADDYLQKEREIKELNDLRIKTLERLVKEKVDIIH
jgi:hypothetical protein